MTKLEFDKIQSEIISLPQGNISYKTISGHKYAYYQWTENGKQYGKRIPDNELSNLINQMERRKELQHKIKNETGYNNAITTQNEDYKFNCFIRLGSDLNNFTKIVKGWKKRNCYKELYDFIYGAQNDKVFILYGLRRTGKTTLIRQIINEMSSSRKKQTAFIQVKKGLSLSDVNKDLRHLEKNGYKYIFVDEVTLLDDFIEGAALFSDIFASSGIKVVLSGTDSLGFIFAKDEQLYDRSIMCHTTFIPYREFEYVLGIKGIDNFIQFGGTMSISGKNYNTTGIFSSAKNANEYLDSAIAKNIQHSLKSYQNEGHFRSLFDLYEKNELTSAINRVVEDINHRFTIEVLTKDWKSNDIGISARNLRNDRESPNDILDNIDINGVTETLKNLLEIKNKEEQTILITDIHKNEIKEYLELLDLIVEIETRWFGTKREKENRIVFSQPGIRYSQANALITSLMQDEHFMDMPLKERTLVSERILEEIRGRMMEEIVLLETKIANIDLEVFRLQFAIGEFDMVVFDPKNGNCRIYEIKHSEEIVPEQYRHLVDEKKCKDTKKLFGEIIGKYVIYRGNNCIVDNGVEYVNVEKYLGSLG